MINPQIRYVVYRYSHHSPHSGYSRTAEYGARIFNSEIIKVSKPLPKSIIRERILWRLADGTPGYDRASMAAELKVAWQILRERDYIYHFLYGETTYHYAGHLNNLRGNRLVATFHQPPVGIRKAVHIDWHIQQLSAVICVGRNQQEYFKGKLDDDRIFFVPLGVDTEYYTPPASFEKRNPNLCLFVGTNYRDFPTLRGVIDLVAYHRPQVQFIALTSSKSFERLGQHPNLTLLSGIPESELYNLYQTAALMVMPLHDATANNAILESMACGLPMVITDVGAVGDYVNPESAVLISPNDSRGMAEAVLDLMESPSERQKLAVESRKQAVKFAWPDVVQQLRSVYEAVA